MTATRSRMILILLLAAGVGTALAADRVHDQGRVGTFAPEPYGNAYEISFSNGYKIDTRMGEPSLPERYRLDAPDQGSAYRIIQFTGPIRQDMHRDLERIGITTFGYLPNYAVMAKLDPAQCEAARGLACVAWVGMFQPAYKLEEALLNASGPKQMAIQVMPGESYLPITEYLLANGGKILDITTDPHSSTIAAEISATHIPALAKLNAVLWMQELGECTTTNNMGQWVTQTGWRNTAPSNTDTIGRRVWKKGVRGQRQVLGVSDTGLNLYTTGHDMFRDPAYPNPSRPFVNPNHRKVVAYKRYQGADVTEGQYHGSHVNGTVAGDDSAVGGTSYYDGMSIKARLYFEDLTNGTSFVIPTNFWATWDTIHASRGLPDSLRCYQHSGSWGWSNSSGTYLIQDASTDAYAWAHKDFLNIMAAGNESSTRRIRNPGIAKNVMTVGALQNGIYSNAIASFSSRGPTQDGRMKPNICAPGLGIYSATRSTGTNTYSSMDGTSMATPMVNGAVGLIRCYLKEGFYPTGTKTVADTFGYISAALLRSMTYASADPNVGSYVVPSNDIGWGRIDIDSVLYFTGDTRRLRLKDDTIGLSTGQYAEYTFRVDNASVPLRVVLSWTDTAAAASANPTLVNNLNLLLTNPSGITYRGNKYTSGQSTQNPTTWDTLNTDEAARINAPATGIWTLRVNAANVVRNRQPYAWTVTGAVSDPYTNDVQTTSITYPTGTVSQGAVIAPQAVVRNNGTSAATFQVKFDISDGYTNTQTVTGLAAGASQTVTFGNWNASTTGSFTTKCSTRLTGDENPANDKATGSVSVQGLDVQTVSIITPTGTVNLGAAITPQASIKNNSASTQVFPVKFDIGTGYTSTITCTLTAGQTRTVNFAAWTAGPLGNLAVKCSTRLTGDITPANDKVAGTVFVQSVDVQTTSILAPTGTVNQGTVIAPQAVVQNNGNQNAIFPVVFTIAGGYTQTRTCTLAAGASATLTYPNWTAATLGTFATKCTTQLTGDMVPANDKQTGSVLVISGPDVQTVAIIAPAGNVARYSSIAPQATVRNNSTTVQTFPVKFDISDGYTSTVTVETLAAGATRTITFANWSADILGSLTTKCSTQFTGDNAPGNDKVSGAVNVVVIDAEVLAIAAPTGTVNQGTVITPSATVRNNGTAAATFDTRMDIGTLYTNTQTVTSLSPGATQTVNFTAWTATEIGVLAVKCTSLLAGDGTPTNNFKTGSVTVTALDIGVTAITNPPSQTAPGSITPQARLHNYGTTRDAASVTMLINSPTPYTSTIALPAGLPIGADTLIDFAAWNAPSGSFVARCSTYLAGDVAPANDTLSLAFDVGVIDAAVTAIVAPTGSLDTGAVITPSARVRNDGDFTATFTVTFKIAELYIEQQTVTSLLPGDSASLTFPEWAKPHNPGTYATRCSLYLVGDASSGNDVLTGSFTITGAGGGPTGWQRLADIPLGGRSKKVKDGGALVFADPSNLYAFKGNNTFEFYRYNTADNTWTTLESIPAIGNAGKKKAVKKGSALAYADGKVYGVKGNNSYEFWQYTPGPDYAWTQLADVPLGAKTIREGCDMATVRIDDTTYIYLLKGSATQELYRYNTNANRWETRSNAPVGASGKPWKNGSAIAYDGEKTIYFVKGTYNEFFTYTVDSEVWAPKASLPLIGSLGKKKKVKDGAGLECYGTLVYGLKGGNTREFYSYNLLADQWTQLEDMPAGGGRNVKGGGALAAGEVSLYAGKGNNTFEFYAYSPLVQAGSKTGNSAQSSILTLHSSIFNLRISPNPLTDAATITYTLPRAGHVSLTLYDITGQLVTTLAEGYHRAGSSSFSVQRSAFSSGIYLLRLTTANGTVAQKLIIE